MAGSHGYLRMHGYDHVGRPRSETATISGETFRTSRSYDSAGRVATVSYPKKGFGVGYEYAASGYSSNIYSVESPGTVYWTAEEVNAEGQITQAMLGNGVGTTRSYDPETGLVESIQSGKDGNTEVQDLGYVFDSLGNLNTREDSIQGVYESFDYDLLNRLTGGAVYDALDDTEREDKTYSYDAVGNIVNKSDVGDDDYEYGTGNEAGSGEAGPHAVVSAGGNTYEYDDNGNMTSGAGKAMTWTSFNKPQVISDSTTTSAFIHGPERARIQQTRVQGATTTIKYVGTMFEQVEKTGGATQYVHYVFAGERRVAVYTTDDAAAPTEMTRYLHQDHLGSVDTITDETGAVVERLSYDAFGKRRTATGTDAWTDSVIAITPGNTPRGFTDHEHLDDFELVHMNGRVYDPVLGRFLSPDPFVQYPESTQGFNRYTYTSNNPLSFTDPSGYFLSEPDWDADYEVDDDEENGGSYGCDGCGYTGNDEDELYGYDPWDDTSVRPGDDVQITNGGIQVEVYQYAKCPCYSDPRAPNQSIDDFWEDEQRPPTFETIKNEMREFIEANDVKGFWNYRDLLGDPVAKIALEINGSRYGTTLRARFINSRLELAATHGTRRLSPDQWDALKHDYATIETRII